MNRFFFAFILVFIFLNSELLLAKDLDPTVRDCDSIVWSAVQRKDIMKLATTYRDVYDAWQCSSTFKTHDEAINSGLDIGTVIYGVPLKIGGTFDASAREEWRAEHCSQQSRVVDTSTLLELTKNDLSPADVQVYKICVEGVARLAAREGLFCWAEPHSQNGVTVFINWRPPSDAPATIISASVSGATPMTKRVGDEAFLLAGDHIKIGTTILGFERELNAASTKFILNTTAGGCDAESASKAYFKVSGWMQPKITITETKTFSQHVSWTSDNCDLIENRTTKHCVDDGWTRINQSWRTTGDRCGSAVRGATADGNCATYQSYFRGCGTEGPSPFKNCKGSPLLQFYMDVVGTKTSSSVGEKETFSKEGAYVDQLSIGYSRSVDPRTPISGWNYNVDVLVSRGLDKKKVSLSNAQPDSAGLKSYTADGNLVINLGD